MTHLKNSEATTGALMTTSQCQVLYCTRGATSAFRGRARTERSVPWRVHGEWSEG